ncbi:MAG: sorbitol-6-phosphate dehydrogenase [Armatimonadota bacterium]|nr:sorbitol-6-phosphate dehydrogenase [bacterium]
MCEARFKGKIALVTGGAQGLGEAVCRRLAGEGATVIVTDIDEEGAKAAADNITTEYGVCTLGMRMDVTDDFAVHTTMEMIERDFGRLDILVVNAGILRAYGIEEFPVSEWRQVVDVNLMGYMICAKHACQIMMKRKSGNIIQINSMWGKRGSARNSAYSASKFGGIGLTQSLALEMAQYNVRVNAVCPCIVLDGTREMVEHYAKTHGLTDEQMKQRYVDQVPLGRGCTYDDVTSVVAFLASDEAAYMTGQAIDVTGGQVMG